jgi:hypothetical protein
MAAGRVRAGKAFTRPRAYPRCRPVPAREHTRGRKILPVPAPGGYPRVSGIPAPAAAALLHAPLLLPSPRAAAPVGAAASSPACLLAKQARAPLAAAA